MKLALAEVVADRPPEDLLRREAERLMGHFISDNTSPETHSFYTTRLSPVNGSGQSFAAETCRRMLFSQLLVMYANRRFKLAAHGQRALIYMAPHPPQRQKWLNELIPDSFYRDLFMSPCLSGWDRGEEKHAYMKIGGRPVTPFGPEWLDRMVSRLLHLKGDFVRDYRLIDYLACLMSTPTSSALSGELGNDIRLKRDLAAMGIFDQAMPLYLLYRLRPFSQLGFSGFEGRHYSQFESIADDMTGAVNLQALVTALAFKWVVNQDVTHADIPDTPNIESERRQIFFGAAIGLPTFFISAGSPNRFLKRLVPEIQRTRPSNRYPGYIRIHQREYGLGLLRLLRREAAELVEGFGLAATLEDLEQRVRHPEGHAASGRLTRGILEEAGVQSPLKLSGTEFNTAAEAYYRGTLRRRQMQEGLALLAEDLAAIDAPRSWRRGFYNPQLLKLRNGRNAREFLDGHREALLDESASESVLQTLIRLFILTIHEQSLREETAQDPTTSPLPPAS